MYVVSFDHIFKFKANIMATLSVSVTRKSIMLHIGFYVDPNIVLQQNFYLIQKPTYRSPVDKVSATTNTRKM
jgi:hypothetical protein